MKCVFIVLILKFQEIFDEKSLRNKREEINLNHYRDLISDLNDLGVYKIILTGGDPFVKPKILELIDLISNTNIVFDIYTNGLNALGRVEKVVKIFDH